MRLPSQTAAATGIALLLAGCGGGSSPNSPAAAPEHVFRDGRLGLTAAIPGGWRVVRQRISGVVYPAQDFVAASFPVSSRHPPKTGCSPKGILRQLPPQGVLMQVIEYAPRLLIEQRRRGSLNRAFPQRPKRFTYPRGSFANYECAGPSYKLTFRAKRRAIQVQIWMHKKTVDSKRRRQALQMLDSLHLRPKVKTP